MRKINYIYYIAVSYTHLPYICRGIPPPPLSAYITFAFLHFSVKYANIPNARIIAMGAMTEIKPLGLTNPSAGMTANANTEQNSMESDGGSTYPSPYTKKRSASRSPA